MDAAEISTITKLVAGKMIFSSCDRLHIQYCRPTSSLDSMIFHSLSQPHIRFLLVCSVLGSILYISDTSDLAPVLVEHSFWANSM